MKTWIKLYGAALCLSAGVISAYAEGNMVNNKATVSVAQSEEFWSCQAVKTLGKKVADWQIKEFPNTSHGAKDQRGWVAGAWYMGLCDWAELSDDSTYYKWMKKTFSGQRWQLGNRMYHADDFCVAQTYIDLYEKFRDKNMLEPTLARTEWVVNHPSNGSVDFRVPQLRLERWTWCDALFMAPAVYTRLYRLTGNRKYMHFMDAEFKATYNHLYDKEEKMFYRDSRYFDQREANGKKVFWGRGNGWVIAGLAEILKTLLEADTEFRPFYEALFTEFATRLAGLQGKDGYWHASLLDPDSYPSPETSSTGFIVYGLAYGINHGYLPAADFLPIVKKGWQALTEAVDPDGKLCWVQPIGADPKKVTRDMTELYGPGAFLMTACEVYKLCSDKD